MLDGDIDGFSIPTSAGASTTEPALTFLVCRSETDTYRFAWPAEPQANAGTRR